MQQLDPASIPMLSLIPSQLPPRAMPHGRCVLTRRACCEQGAAGVGIVFYLKEFDGGVSCIANRCCLHVHGAHEALPAAALPATLPLQNQFNAVNLTRASMILRNLQMALRKWS